MLFVASILNIDNPYRFYLPNWNLKSEQNLKRPVDSITQNPETIIFWLGYHLIFKLGV